ncbi:uncharacterized protein EDB91DRAFT_851445 [Suillus paluster]|uniref:uncharacterized protein n=1 Tax=Suillus paluster TaxID=48578 RepID=UPI001B85E9C6|nr:uncharacterized protein EDB91DRAFT_851445 [Suillus paluster]KAG1728627.1 hypothetical protein EDB91DRAFT_851445 [Suillus paluster]
MVNNWRLSENYYQRLVDHYLTSQSRTSQKSSSPSGTLHTDRPCCPICSHHLVACNGCSIVTCSANGQCAGADLITLVSCHVHDNLEKFCAACLTDERYSGALIQCMHCWNWHCPEIMKKCVGRPISSDKLGRAHAPKFISCRSCFSAAASMQECSEFDCWSCAHIHDDVICLDCIGSMDSHIACPCGWTWVRGACAQKTDSGGRCPGCQTFYCFDQCGYIDACTECHKTTLCNDCMEEDLSDEEGSSMANKGLVLVTTCKGCQRSICADCFEEREFCCGSCDSVRCWDCMGDGKCSGCGALMCLSCTEAGCGECRVGKYSTES